MSEQDKSDLTVEQAAEDAAVEPEAQAVVEGEQEAAGLEVLEHLGEQYHDSMVLAMKGSPQILHFLLI